MQTLDITEAKVDSLTGERMHTMSRITDQCDASVYVPRGVTQTEWKRSSAAWFQTSNVWRELTLGRR